MAKPNPIAETRSDTNAATHGAMQGVSPDKQYDGGIHVGSDFRNQPHSKDPGFETFSGGKPDGKNYAIREGK